MTKRDGQRRARQCYGNPDPDVWFLQEWTEKCFHPGCKKRGHWVTMIYAGNFTEELGKKIAAAHNRCLERA